MEDLTISEKELLKNKLNEEIKTLGITKENLITSIHDLKVHSEADKKVGEVEMQRERNRMKKEISDLKDSLTSQMKQIETQKEAYLVHYLKTI